MGKKKNAEEATLEQPSAANVLDIFNNAPKTAPTTVKKSKSSVSEEVDFGQKFDCLAALKIVEKIVENEGSLLEGELKQEVIEHYVKEMLNEGKKPGAFIGKGVVSSGYCEIRKKASTAQLAPEIIERLQKNGLPFDKQVKVPERYTINPEIVSDQETLVRLATLIKSDPVLSQKTIIQKQAEEFSYSTSESTIDCLAKTQNESLIRELLTSVANFAIGKFSVNGANITDKETKSVTPEAKRTAFKILQEMEVLPITAKKK